MRYTVIHFPKIPDQAFFVLWEGNKIDNKSIAQFVGIPDTENFRLEGFTVWVVPLLTFSYLLKILDLVPSTNREFKEFISLVRRTPGAEIFDFTDKVTISIQAQHNPKYTFFIDFDKSMIQNNKERFENLRETQYSAYKQAMGKKDRNNK